MLDNKLVRSRVHLPSYNVQSIRVLKGEEAVKRFGEEGKNGVVIITTKRNSSNQVTLFLAANLGQ